MPHVRQELSTLPENLSLIPFLTCLSEVRAVHVVKLCFHVFCSVLWYPLRFPRNVRFVLTSICRGLCFIYVYWCRTRFLYQMMFGSFNGNTTSVTCGAETAYPSKTSPDFSVVRIARSLVFCVKFCRSLSVLFLLTIVFDVIPRLTAFDYSFAIFKLFWHTWYIYLNFP